MRLDELFKNGVAALRERGIPFAVAGGFAADIYRSEHRVTHDIDVVLKYLAGQMRRFDLTVPKALLDSAPEALAKASRDIAKAIRKRRRG